MAVEENRVVSVAGTVGLVVLVVALLLAAIRWGSGGHDPLVADPHTSAAVATSPGVTRTTPVDQRRRGAIARVPRAVIMRQLARLAERIARHTPMPTIPSGISAGSNQALGYHLLIEFGFAADQWPYLNALWTRESGWNHLAENPTSGAYGIPQSLPATKMAVVGPDWRTNPETQIKWGLAYISARYGTPQGAWAHETRFGWY